MMTIWDLPVWLALGAAAIGDWRDYRIPNQAILITLFWLAVREMAAGRLVTLAPFIGRMALALVLGFGLFRLGAVGAGDVKMAAVMTGFLGLSQGLFAIGTGLSMGAFLGVYKLLRSGSLRERLRYLRSYGEQWGKAGKGKPYYRPERDGYGMVIPLGTCLYAGMLAVCCGNIR